MAQAYPVLERALAAHPSHAGLIHYYIHVMEQAATPDKAEPYADKLAALMPGAGHLVHMPSHTYFVLGRYKDSLAANIDAVAADEAFMAQAEPSAMYRFGYYPHNIHFALESAAMIGEGRQALAFADKLAAALPAESFRQVVMSQPIGLAPMFAKLRFASADDILALANPGDDVPFMKGVWLHALGIGHVLKGDLPAAKAKADELARLRATADLALLETNAVPAGAVLEIAEHVLRGRIAAAGQDWTAAIGHFEQAVAGQDALPYMEPAYWYYPVRQSLGAALVQAGRAKEAVDVLRAGLMDVPNNGWALWVLAEAAEKAGDAAGAAEYRKLFAKAWTGASPPPRERI
jgi:tetratricopeptide (TPR) repeat protein